MAEKSAIAIEANPSPINKKEKKRKRDARSPPIDE